MSLFGALAPLTAIQVRVEPSLPDDIVLVERGTEHMVVLSMRDPRLAEFVAKYGSVTISQAAYDQLNAEIEKRNATPSPPEETPW